MPPLTRRPRLFSLALACLAVITLAAWLDGRFWLRYMDRVPALIGIPGAGTPNSIPSTRATITGSAASAPLARCPAGRELQTTVEAADRWMKERATEAFLVWHDGCLVHERYFEGDAQTLRPAGAMAKSLMALVVGRAIREGHLRSLDQTVASHLAEWRNDGRRAIRYRDLLSMHAGLAWYHQTASPFGDFQRIILASDYAPRALRLPQVAPPGKLYDYSAWTYDILGIALARATGRPYEQLVSELLARPLGLSEQKIYIDRPGGTVHGNCCLFSRADDWVRLGALLVAESERSALLPPGFVGAMRAPGPDQPNYGLGVWLGSPYRGDRLIASHRNPYPTPVKSVIAQSEPFIAADVLIYEGVENNKVWIVPSRRLVIVRFGKRSRNWDDAAVPNMLIKAING